MHDPPDGHDVLWPKVVEFVLGLPFLLGFKTGTVSQVLAALTRTRTRTQT